jgi:hypothetical protein
MTIGDSSRIVGGPGSTGCFLIADDPSRGCTGTNVRGHKGLRGPERFGAEVIQLGQFGPKPLAFRLGRFVQPLGQFFGKRDQTAVRQRSQSDARKANAARDA